MPNESIKQRNISIKPLGHKQPVINVPVIPEIHTSESGTLRSISMATQTKQNIPKPEKEERKPVLEEQTARAFISMAVTERKLPETYEYKRKLVRCNVNNE